jgi:hypothetical protein
MNQVAAIVASMGTSQQLIDRLGFRWTQLDMECLA